MDKITAISFLVLGILIGMCIDTVITDFTDIELRETQGKVISVKLNEDNYLVEVETACLHAGNHNSINLLTKKKYQVGDTIHFE